MLSDLPINWIVWGVAAFVALRCLMSLSILLKDRLQDLLIAHVKRQQIESKKRQRIAELREKIRAKKAADAPEPEVKRAA
jgi:hypothetical protein